MLNRRTITAIKQSENLAANIARGIQVSPEDVCLLEDHLWSITKGGYAITRFDGKTLTLHGLVFERMTGSKPPMNGKNRHSVRHIIADTKLDCRRENIHPIASSQANACDMNVTLNRKNTSGVSGVSWNKRTESWQVGVSFNGRSIGLGLFNDLGLAALVANTVREARCWLIAQNYTITPNEVKEYLQRVARSAVAAKELIDYRLMLTINSDIRNDQTN